MKAVTLTAGVEAKQLEAAGVHPAPHTLSLGESLAGEAGVEQFGEVADDDVGALAL